MRRISIAVLIFIITFSLSVNASDIKSDISDELGLNSATELVPQSLTDTDINFSPNNSPGENGMSIKSIFRAIFLSFFEAFKSELPFVSVMIVIFVLSSVIFSFIENARSTLGIAVKFAISTVVSAFLIKHMESAFIRASEFVTELTTFMTGILPFIGSLSLVGGEVSTASVQNAILMSVITLLQSVLTSVVLPISKIVMSIAIVGYISDISLSGISDIISNFATKFITVSCAIMCAVLYFQNTVTTVTDSLALRSVKIAAGNFIPIVGSFVSEASGTLLSGVKLVKSTFGIFAICILIYMSVRPIMNFIIMKLSLRFLGAISKIIGCTKEGKIMGDILSVYNVLSAIMIASVCFFVFAVSVFIKSEVR